MPTGHLLILYQNLVPVWAGCISRLWLLCAYAVIKPGDQMFPFSGP